MPTYQGPNTQVTQVFKTTPAAIAIETLPSAVVATPYEVKAKEDLGDAIGIIDVDYNWVKTGSNKVIYDNSIAGQEVYDFFPVKHYGRDASDSEDYDISTSMTGKSATKATLPIDTAFTKRTVASGSSVAQMPYTKVSGTDIVTIEASNLKKVVCATANFKAANIQRGQEVVYNSTGTTWKYLGFVDSVSSNTTLYLQSDYTAPISGAATSLALVVGARIATDLTVGDTIAAPGTKVDVPAYVYDTNADFNQYSRGDFVSAVVSPGLDADITSASIVSVLGENLIEIFTGTATSGNTTPASQTGYSLYDYYSAATTSSFASLTPSITSYMIKRFVGFTGKYTTTGTLSAVLANKVTLSTAAVQYNVGDYFTFDTSLNVYKVTQLGTTADIYYLDATPTESSGNHYAFRGYDSTEVVRSEVLGTYRSVDVANLGTVLNSSDNQLTGTDGVFGEASVYNELAFMIEIVLGLNSGRVMYSVGVDPTQTLSTQYADAMEALKFYNVYSHAFGTTEAGVNALVPSYLDGQSAPYEGHERIGVVAYNNEDVYLLGSDTGATGVDTAGLVTIAGTIDLRSIGLGIGDTVKMLDSDDVLQSMTVTASPTATTVQTDWDGSAIATSSTVNFLAGVASKQAQRVRALGATSNRRFTVAWAGDFKADTLATSILEEESAVSLPQYYLAAAVVGLDGGQKVSQSLTRLSFAIPGLSNIQLGTSSVFRKSELDTIGGGGIDIMVQDAAISNLIYSRHDLTTDMSAVQTRERSATKQADQTAKTYRESVDPYIGKFNITPSLLEFLTNVLNNAKKTLVKEGVVAGVQNKGVKRDPDIADKVNMQITITIFVAGNYYDITLTVVS